MSANVRLFMAYRVVSRLYFHLPVLFLLFWSLHVSYAMATLLLAAYSGASTLAGDLAPRLAQRLRAGRLVVLGEFAKSLGLALLIAGTWPGDVSLPVLFAGQVIGGTGFAIALAADGGLLRVVTPGADAATLGRIQARTQSLMFLATLVAGFIGGVLFDHEGHWAFYAGIGASLASIATVLLIVEPAAATPPASSPATSAPPAPLQLSREQQTWVGFYAITRAFALAPFIGLLPLHFALQQVDPYLFGLVLGLFTLGGFAVALWGAPVLRALGPEGGVWVSCGGIVASLAMFALSSVLEQLGIGYFPSALVGIALLGIAAGAIRPVVMSRLDLSGLTPPQRIAVFARMERSFGYLSATLLIAFGVLVESASITTAFGSTLLMLLATLAAGALWRHLSSPAPAALPGTADTLSSPSGSARHA
jgi:MFS family permease